MEVGRVKIFEDFKYDFDVPNAIPVQDSGCEQIYTVNYEVSYYTQTSNNKANPGRGQKSPILADFVYDQSEVLSIMFNNEEMGYPSRSSERIGRKQKCKGTAHYQIVVRLQFFTQNHDQGSEVYSSES
ncbi:hypothetical protein ANCCAN_12270 [Ancylostoma caninum]|uniref:PH-like domain-containing protein n=1 Tax=Ancylostoma caninum TaxID=29170 RepID=A0A368GBK1_ANCCA|nr:hypothetical protein ANCCAN_12270 [Ancylostoma caninum]